MKIHNFEQQSEEWFEFRKGRMSASHAQAIGTAKKGLDTYINDLMAEYYSTGEKLHFTNKDIERGIELEELARPIYELENNVKVTEVGCIEMNEFVSCSPDGLVKDDGGIEIKALNDAKHFSLLVKGKTEIESKYIWQIQMCLFITGRKWWDFIAYNPNFKRSTIVHRIEPDLDKFKKLEVGIKIGTEKIKEIKELLNKI